MNRSQLMSTTKEMRDLLVRVQRHIDVKPDEWYASVWFQNKLSKQFGFDFKKNARMDERQNTGIVLRVFDGFTMYEQATDQLNETALLKQGDLLLERVSQGFEAKKNSGARPEPYLPPSWSDRLNQDLEKEIQEQIPADVKKETPVHFGLRMKINPDQVSSEERLKRLEKALDQIKSRAEQNGIQPEEITFGSAGESVSQEDTLFVDREVNLSQSLTYQLVSISLRAGAERNRLAQGGLGGDEILHLNEKGLDTLVQDLAKVKSAGKIDPGRYDLITGPEVSGVLAHEAFGHSQEADTCARGRSKAWDLFQSGEQVGNDLATIMNNPAMYENGEESHAAWGSYFFDEEGWFAAEQVILDKGKLQSPMTNLTSAIRLGVERSANGKRQDWSSGVYSRQTNTYFTEGKETLEGLISKVHFGYLGEYAAGGMEDPKGMGIQVGMIFLKEIKDGKLTGKVFKGPSGGAIQLTGYTPTVLASIEGKSKINAHSEQPDQARFPYNDAGGCGKYHKELVKAGSGGPYMLLRNVTLG